MQNVGLDVALKNGRIPISFSPQIEHGFVDLQDLAKVVCSIISDPKHHNYARYELVAENTSYDNIAQLISKEAKKNVHCHILPMKDYLNIMMSSYYVRNEHAEDAIVRMMMYYDRWGVLGNPNVLRYLLGREPTRWKDYLKRELRTSS